jgi:tetratricopeptide (TPR) repeat protein
MKWLIKILLFLIFISCASKSKINQTKIIKKESEKICVKAKNEYLLGNLKASIELYENCINNDTFILSNYVELAKIYENLGKYDKARELYKKALILDKNFKEAKLLLANILIRENKFNETLRLIDDLGSDEKKEILVNLYIQKREFSRALNLAKEVLLKKPENTYILNNIIRIYIIEKNYIQAIEVLNKILKINSTNFFAYNNLGIIELEKNNTDNATIYFKKAIEINNNFLLAYKNLIYTLICVGNYKEAIKYLKKIIEFVPSSEYFNDMAIVYSLDGEYWEARNIWEYLLKKEKNLIYYYKIGFSFYEEKKYEKAIEYFKKYMNETNEYPQEHEGGQKTIQQIKKFIERIENLKKLKQFG